MWYPHCSLLPHLACIRVPRIHKHDHVTLPDATNQHSQFPRCEQCPKLYYLQALQELDDTLQHQQFSYWFICLLAYSLLCLKAEHQNSSSRRKESQPEGSCLLPRGSLLWKTPQGRMEVSARQAGPLPTLFGQQCLAENVQGELVAMNLLTDTYTHRHTADVYALSCMQTSAFMYTNSQCYTYGGYFLQDSLLSGTTLTVRVSHTLAHASVGKEQHPREQFWVAPRCPMLAGPAWISLSPPSLTVCIYFLPALFLF